MHCPLCESEQNVLFHDNVWSLEGGQVFRYLNCDATFIHPLIDDEQESDFYQNIMNTSKSTECQYRAQQLSC